MKMAISGGGPGAPITTDSSGAPAGKVVAEIQQPAVAIETIVITINAAADLITAPAAPIAAELITVVPDTLSTHKKVRVTWHCQSMANVVGADSEIPLAAYAQVTVGAADDTAALARLAVADAGVGDHTASQECLAIAAQNPECNFDVTGTTATIDRVDIGAYPPTGDTGEIPVYIQVVFY